MGAGVRASQVRLGGRTEPWRRGRGSSELSTRLSRWRAVSEPRETPAIPLSPTSSSLVSAVMRCCTAFGSSWLAWSGVAMRSTRDCSVGAALTSTASRQPRSSTPSCTAGGMTTCSACNPGPAGCRPPALGAAQRRKPSSRSCTAASSSGQCVPAKTRHGQQAPGRRSRAAKRRHTSGRETTLLLSSAKMKMLYSTSSGRASSMNDAGRATCTALPAAPAEAPVRIMLFMIIRE